MSILTHLIGVALNFVATPLADAHAPYQLPNTTSTTITSTSAICRPVTLQMGDNELRFSMAPKGQCTNCCPIKPAHDIRLLYYGGNTSVDGVEIRDNGTKWLDPMLPTVIFIHGFSETSPGQSGREIVNAYKSRPEFYNILIVDWSRLAVFPWYSTAVRNVKLVAIRLANFLQRHHQSGVIKNMHNVHLIGFSLGAHMAGIVGKIMRTHNLEIGRITALDPALPEYDSQSTGRKLQRDDAHYVDVIHTDSGVFGIATPIGHTDYYPNGGKPQQPGCQPIYLVTNQIIDQIFACSHVRAWKLYAESVKNPTAFPATTCARWRGTDKLCQFSLDGYMGFASNSDTKGKLYLTTNHKSPYARSIQEQQF